MRPCGHVGALGARGTANAAVLTATNQESTPPHPHHYHHHHHYTHLSSSLSLVCLGQAWLPSPKKEWWQMKFDNDDEPKIGLVRIAVPHQSYKTTASNPGNYRTARASAVK